jgi:tetratricopeptide (TPR) repeat protein
LSIAELRSGDEGQDPDNGKDPSGRREAALDDYDEDEELEGTAIEVGEDAEPEVVTEQRNPSPYPSPSTWAAQSSASLGIPHSSSVRSGSWGRRMVDPVIGPSFGTRVRERHDPDAESIKQQNNNVNHVLKSSLRSTPLTGDPSFTLDAPIPEIRFPVEDSLHWNYSQQQPRDNTASEDRPSSSTLPATPRTHPTVPVDLDDCSFLEAEKNLQAIHDMATEHLQQGEYDEALEVFEEILRGQLTRHGTNHPRVGTALHNLGVVHMRREDYALAVQAYREAVAVRRSALYPNHPDVASSLAQLGVAYLERRMHKKAIAAFRESLKIRRKCLGSSHPKVAKILNNIGCALYELNALDVAQVAFEEALVIQRSCLRREPAHNQAKSNFLLLSIASTLCNVASIKLYFGDADAASVDFQEALLIQQCVFGDDHPTPLQTEESLRWIESVRVPPPYHRRPSVPSDTGADAHSGATFGIFSRMFRRSSVSGFAMAEQGNDPALVNVNCETSSSVHPGLLACAVRGDDAARDVLGTVEERLKRLQDQIELACGPPASESFLFEYDDDESESDDEEVRVDEEYGDNFDNELSRIRRAVDV